MKLTYWKAECLGDADCYSIRAKTRKACKALREENGGDEYYGPPTKIVLEYRDGFDLVENLLSESRGCCLILSPFGAGGP